MKSLQRLACLGVVFVGVSQSSALEDLITVSYPGSVQPGQLTVESSFHLWIPPGARRIRAVIVHQHGCGDGAENAGDTAALDLQWRALAARHDAALLAPHYRARGAECRLWCDARNGSGEIFLRALADLGRLSRHPEVAAVPWCLWGHSGGGFWASLMLEGHADRIIAVFCRSGTAASAWTKGEVPEPAYPPAAFGVPVVVNPGLHERGDKQFDGAWVTSQQFFELFRGKGAPIAFAPDPFSGHDCRNSRLLALPFFDACLRLRLTESGKLKSIPWNRGWIGDWESGTTHPAGRHLEVGSTGSWLPDAASARAFSEYVRLGTTSDLSAPRQAPVITGAERDRSNGVVALTWTAAADFESGIREFVIYRGGEVIARLAPHGIARTGFAQYQGVSYHDTPVPNPPSLRFADTNAPPRGRISYAISSVNGAGLEGPRSRKVQVRADKIP